MKSVARLDILKEIYLTPSLLMHNSCSYYLESRL